MTTLESDLLIDLRDRGFLKDCTDLMGLDALLASGAGIAAYAGFDPTADSLHVGNMVSLALLRRFAAHGHTAVAVIGTATAMVGDPSGRSSARPLLDDAAMRANADGVEESIRRVLGDGRNVVVLRNGSWLEGRDFLGTLRELGGMASLGRMLAMESVRSRIGEDGTGMSFLEFSYSLLQGFDFLRLSFEFPSLVQVGGSDQWGNICMGMEFIAKRRGPMLPGGAFRAAGHDRSGEPRLGHAFGLTHPLLTDRNGEKFGKSAGNAVWLNPSRLPTFDFYQFWRNVDDADVAKVAKLLSDIPPGEADAAAAGGVASVNDLKERLAVAMTALVRGEGEARAALAASRSRGASAEGLPTIEATAADIADLPALFVRARLADSKAAARRLSAGGGVRVNGEKTDRLALSPSDFRDGVAVISAGKASHAAVRLLG